MALTRRGFLGAIGFAFEDREAVMMGAEASVEDGVAIEQEMLRRDRGRDSRRRGFDEFRGLLRCDVFENDAQGVELVDQR